MKRQTRLIIFEPAVLEQRANGIFRFLHQLFVVDAMHASGKNGVIVLHQQNIVAIVPPKLRKIVAETLSAREMLFESREAVRHGVPPRVHNFCVWQNQMNQRNVGKIVRHLVNEIGTTALALNARPFEIAVPKRAKFVRTQGKHMWQIAGVVSLGIIRLVPAAEVGTDRRDIGQFHSAFDQRMTGEDLLDQSRTGARQANHEDRVFRGQSLPGHASQHLPRQQAP